jgi:hypothetical protein
LELTRNGMHLSLDFVPISKQSCKHFELPTLKTLMNHGIGTQLGMSLPLWHWWNLYPGWRVSSSLDQS